MDRRLSFDDPEAPALSSTLVEPTVETAEGDSPQLIPQRLLPSIAIAVIGFVILIALLVWAQLDDGLAASVDQTVLAQSETVENPTPTPQDAASGLQSVQSAPASVASAQDQAEANQTTADADSASSTSSLAGSPDPNPTPGETVGDDRLTLRGIGALQIGMTVEEAAAEFGSPVAEVEGLVGECRIATISGDPSSPRFMISVPDGDIASGTIRRIELSNGAQMTLSGVHIGSTKDDVLAAYGDRMTATPHTYATAPDSEYLTYVPIDPADGDYRLVFETDNGIVTAIRTGLVPEVELVDGCG